MGQITTISRLRRRRKALLGSIYLHHALLAKREDELREVDRRILLLKPSFNPTIRIPPQPKTGPKTNGLISRQIVRLLKSAVAPMSAREILPLVKLPPVPMSSDLTRIHVHLDYLLKTGRIVNVGKRRASRWIVNAPTLTRLRA